MDYRAVIENNFPMSAVRDDGSVLTVFIMRPAGKISALMVTKGENDSAAQLLEQLRTEMRANA